MGEGKTYATGVKVGMDFRECRRVLNQLGAQPIQDFEYRIQADGTRQKANLDLFVEVLLPLSPEDWCSLCMNEGSAYLGGCCGNLSRIQDSLNAAFRDNGRIRVQLLKDVIEGLVEHGDLDSKMYPFHIPDELLEEKVRFATRDWVVNTTPLEKIAVTWNLVRQHMSSKMPLPEQEGPEGALSTLARAIVHLNAHFLVSWAVGDKEPSPVQLLALYRLWPALKTAHDRFQEMNPGPLEGWVLVNTLLGPEALTTGDIGTCFFDNFDDIRELVSEWDRRAKLHQDDWGKAERESFKNLAARRVRVSAERGLEFLPDELVRVESLV